MGKLWLKIWIWIKVGIFALLFFYALVFVINNVHNKAILWYAFNREIETTTFMVAICSFSGGVIATLVVRTTLGTIRQIRDLKERGRQQRMQRDLDEMKAKAAMLQPKETPAPGDSAAKI